MTVEMALSLRPYNLLEGKCICPKCGGILTPHRASQYAGAHFEHLVSKGCKLMTYGKLRKPKIDAVA
jgi:hypothetical protein